MPSFVRKAPMSKRRTAPPSQNINRIVKMKRHCDFLNIPLTNIGGAAGAFTFELSDLPAYTELTALYDQYRIDGVLLTFYPRQTSVTNNTLFDQVKGEAKLFTCIDYNDLNPPATADEVRQYESCKVTSLIKEHTVYVKKPLFVNTSGQNTSDFVSTANPSTRWYGCKYYAEPPGMTSATAQFFYSVEAVFYLSFKNIK